MRNYTPATLAEEIRDAVDCLVQGYYTCITIKLDDTLAVCIGWTEGVDPDDPSVIHSEIQPTYALCIAIKAWRSDNMRTDFDYINMPYYDNGGIIGTSCLVRPGTTDYTPLASVLLGEFNAMKDLDIDTDGHIHGKER